MVEGKPPQCPECRRKVSGKYKYSARSMFPRKLSQSAERKFYAQMGVKPKGIPKSSASVVSFTCSCGQLVTRLMTRPEISLFQRIDQESHVRTMAMHKVSHEYQRSFRKADSWRWEGYELMKRFEKFAKKWPSVTICRCDDAFHSSSNIVLIPHELPDYYWGTTVIVIPQNSGPPCQFFLYDTHTSGLAEALGQILKKHKRNKDDY